MKTMPKVRDFMTARLITLHPETEINRAMKTLLDNRVSGAPVLDAAGRMVGVLSKKDCLKAALHASYFRQWDETVADFMSTDVQTLDAELDLIAAAEVFVDSAFRRFPVMEEGRLIGQISRTDVLRGLAENWD